MFLGDIIKAYRTVHHLSMDEFSVKCGISKAYISLLEKNQHPKTGKTIAPSIQIIKQAAEGMDMDFHTLFNMLNSETTTDTIYNHISKRQYIKKINILGDIPFNINHMEEANDIVGTLEVMGKTANTENLFAMQIRDDSMEPKISQGDIVIAHQQTDAESDDIVIAVFQEKTAICKRLKKYADGIIFLSTNPKYDPIVFTHQEIAEKTVKIIGRVIEMRSWF